METKLTYYFINKLFYEQNSHTIIKIKNSNKKIS